MPENELAALIAQLESVYADEHPVLDGILAYGSEAVEPLIAQLQDNDEYGVRTDACVLLGKIGDPLAIPALFEALFDWDIRHVRPQAQIALANFGRPALEYVLARLDGGDTRTTTACIYMLLAFAGPDAISALIRLAASPVFEIRLRAAEALCRLGECQYLDLLADVLETDDGVLAHFAIHAIHQLVEKSHCLAEVDSRVAPILNNIREPNSGEAASPMRQVFQQTAIRILEARERS
ncbi:hypothetical protein CCAX7_55830 [Capsulimonas corticalis]|uniref:Uncharacterized protein n=1 Tax=Capsulimonas corticalis TaxID=2219043 RepID=A0A402D0R0_9BACT|nr:HEAT repeat domain-containing protein [Capsulimonas corticalis]BDI33532.1 hypothetical protein CCAX7_55830 [Capsulimonas corticalis]